MIFMWNEKEENFIDIGRETCQGAYGVHHTCENVFNIKGLKFNNNKSYLFIQQANRQ